MKKLLIEETGQRKGLIIHAKGLSAASLRQIRKNHLVGAVLLLAFLLNVSPLWSQSLEHLFSQRFGDTESDSGRAIAVDGARNVLVTGEFRGTVDFGGGPLSSAGDRDIFLAKYDAAGAHLWSQRFGPQRGTGDLAEHERDSRRVSAHRQAEGGAEQEVPREVKADG